MGQVREREGERGTTNGSRKGGRGATHGTCEGGEGERRKRGRRMGHIRVGEGEGVLEEWDERGRVTGEQARERSRSQAAPVCQADKSEYIALGERSVWWGKGEGVGEM